MLKLRIGFLCAAAGLLTISVAGCQTLTGDDAAPVEISTVETASRTVEDGGTGPHPAVMVGDSSLPTHTIFRPADLGAFGKKNKLAILAWGNGACANSPSGHINFLSEVASHGILVIAIGPMAQEGQGRGGMGGGGRTQSSQLIDAIDWAIAQNADKTSQYYNKIDTAKIAVSGMSCGGLQALEVAGDPRITTTIICNSGVLNTSVGGPAGPGAPGRTGGPGGGMPGMPAVTKERLNELHSPIMYMLGGESDIAYANGMDDFKRIDHVPAFVGNLNIGHGGTYMQPHGGDYAKVMTAWCLWQLKGDKEAAKMFQGDPCGVAEMQGWTIEKKNID
jgi:hypothetical protein